MSSAEELSDHELQVLDIVLNLEPVTVSFLTGFKTHEDLTFTEERLKEILDKLSNHKLITLIAEQYQTTVTVTAESRNTVRDILESYWKRNNIDELTLKTDAERNLLGILKLLEFRYDDKPHIGFSDYFMDRDSLDICNRLARARLLFKQTWSSRKHYYESYYLRKFPFDTGKSLEQLIVEKINLKDVEIGTEWPMLITALYSDAALTLADLRSNFPYLTSDEINEFLSKLEQRGVLSRLRGEITIPKGTRDIVMNYFLFHQYNQFKNLMLQQLRKRVGERPSNLFILGLVKRILASAPFLKTSEPFCSIKRDLLPNISEGDLKEACKLGIVFLTSKEVIVACEIVAELESALKSALTVESFMTIPPNDNLRAMQAWVQIFGQCEDYVRIWDEYINEETLDIVERFCPRDVAIWVLGAIEKPRQIDIEETEQRVKAIRNTGRKINLFFVGDSVLGKAPFHKRYIISKEACYLLTSSIKDVGKTKGVDIIGIAASVKTSEIEPAFKYWMDTPAKELQQQGYARKDFEKWITDLRSREITKE